MSAFERWLNRLKKSYRKSQNFRLYEKYPKNKLNIFDEFNQNKNKLYEKYKHDDQLKVINKKKSWSLDISRIENNMKRRTPNEYEQNKIDFDDKTPVYNGDVSDFYGKEVKMKRFFYNKRKSII